MAKRRAESSEDARPAKQQRQDVADEQAKKPKATRGRKTRSTKEVTPAPPAAPKAKRINKNLRNKTKKMLDFLDQTQVSILHRDPANMNHVIVTEVAVIAALMCMRADWELTDPRMASMLDVKEAIVKEFEQPLGTLQLPTKYVVLDLDQSTAFNESIQQKIEGHGLEGINLIEAELEMYHRQCEVNAAQRLFDAFVAVEGVPDGDTSQATIDTVQSTASDGETSTVEGANSDAAPRTVTDETPDTSFDVESPVIPPATTENVDQAVDNIIKAFEADSDNAAENTTADDLPPAELQSSPASSRKIDGVGVCPAPMKDL